jgi:hypothetical protein
MLSDNYNYITFVAITFVLSGFCEFFEISLFDNDADNISLFVTKFLTFLVFFTGIC